MDVLMPCDDPKTSINKVTQFELSLSSDRYTMSISQISFNPNLESHTWMCVCGENGLVQLLKIDSHSVSKVTTGYVKEMNNSSIDS